MGREPLLTEYPCGDEECRGVPGQRHFLRVAPALILLQWLWQESCLPASSGMGLVTGQRSPFNIPGEEDVFHQRG